MPEPPSGPESETPAGPSATMRALAVVLFVLPIVGIAAHLALFAAPPEWVSIYFHTGAMPAVAFLAFLNIFGSYFHYRRTGMRLDIASRILANVWLVCMILILAMRIWGR